MEEKDEEKAIGFRIFLAQLFSFFCSLAIDASVISLCLISVLVVNSDDENNRAQRLYARPEINSWHVFSSCSDNILS